MDGCNHRKMKSVIDTRRRTENDLLEWSCLSAQHSGMDASFMHRGTARQRFEVSPICCECKIRRCQSVRMLRLSFRRRFL
jgi:hypothetical protein